MEENIVPVNLLPVNLSSYTDQWAYQTYHCWKHFYSGQLPENPRAEDFQKWKDAAMDMSEELKSLGVSKAHDKICSMMKSFFPYNFGNREFCNMYDVVDFLSDASFFEEHKALFRDMVHMFQYGIFRVGFNAWAMNAAKEWMDERKITYGPGNLKWRRRGKGFVYKLIVSRASNSISDRLQGLTERMYNEYIVVRNKSVKKFGNECHIIPYTFNHRFPGYICVSKSSNMESQLCFRSETNEEKMKLINMLDYKLKNGVSYEKLYKAISNIQEPADKGMLMNFSISL